MHVAVLTPMNRPLELRSGPTLLPGVVDGSIRLDAAPDGPVSVSAHLGMRGTAGSISALYRSEPNSHRAPGASYPFQLFTLTHWEMPCCPGSDDVEVGPDASLIVPQEARLGAGGNLNASQGEGARLDGRSDDACDDDPGQAL